VKVKIVSHIFYDIYQLYKSLKYLKFERFSMTEKLGEKLECEKTTVLFEEKNGK